MEPNFENVAYDWEMLITQLFTTVNKTLCCGYSGYVIMQLINSHYIHQKKKKIKQTIHGIKLLNYLMMIYLKKEFLVK